MEVEDGDGWRDSVFFPLLDFFERLVSAALEAFLPLFFPPAVELEPSYGETPSPRAAAAAAAAGAFFFGLGVPVRLLLFAGLLESLLPPTAST